MSTFEAWEPAGRKFDTVIAAQSWHWKDPVAGALKAAEVLRPNGRVAISGHVFEPPPDVAAKDKWLDGLLAATWRLASCLGG